jgi:hypothetical protein
VLVDLNERRYHDLKRGHNSAHVRSTINCLLDTPLVQHNDDLLLLLEQQPTLIVMSNAPKRGLSAVCTCYAKLPSE